jgi:hypothetical protein
MIHLVLAAAMANSPSQARYNGPPDLALTAAVVDAGGGPKSFSSQRLFTYLAGKDAANEGTALTNRYGAQNVKQFFVTFDAFVDSALTQLTSKGVALPAGKSASGDELTHELYQAGVIPDGRYDVGYMLEHLISRPMHITLMNDVNANPAFGPTQNAEFHVILTSAIQDLNQFYQS